MNHDSGYHLLFSYPEMVADLLCHFVPEPWVEGLDFTTLERVNAKLHADQLKRREGDMIYRLYHREFGEIYIYLLLEFQSSTERWMAVRTMVYIGLLYQHLIRENQLTPDKKLPPVFPLVLYNGNAPWHSPIELSELIYNTDNTALNHWQPQLRYFLVQENTYKNQKLNTLSGYLFQLENCQDIYQLNTIVGELVEFLKDPAQRGIKRAFTRWIKDVLAPSKGISISKLKTKQLEEVKDMLAENIKKWEAEITIKAKSEGRVEGKVEGRSEGSRGIFILLLEKRFGKIPSAILAKIEQADPPHIEAWSLRLLDARTLKEVFKD